MKKIILVSILSAMCSSMAFAQTNNYNSNSSNNYSNDNMNNGNNGMPNKEQQFQYRNSMPPHPTPGTPGLNRNVPPNWEPNQDQRNSYRNERAVGQETEEEYFARENQRPDGRRYAPPMLGYNIDVVLISNGEVIKKYNIPVKPHQEFMIVNTEETTYVESMQKYNKGDKVVNKPIYAKVTSGSAITGIIMPSRMRDGTVNVHLNILNNKLLGFEKSCWTSRHECTELPQQVLSKQDVVVNTSLNNPVNATEFINSKGNKVQVAFKVNMENNPNVPNYQQRQ